MSQPDPVEQDPFHQVQGLTESSPLQALLHELDGVTMRQVTEMIRASQQISDAEKFVWLQLCDRSGRMPGIDEIDSAVASLIALDEALSVTGQPILAVELDDDNQIKKVELMASNGSGLSLTIPEDEDGSQARGPLAVFSAIKSNSQVVDFGGLKLEDLLGAITQPDQVGERSVQEPADHYLMVGKDSIAALVNSLIVAGEDKRLDQSIESLVLQASHLGVDIVDGQEFHNWLSDYRLSEAQKMARFLAHQALRLAYEKQPEKLFIVTITDKQRRMGVTPDQVLDEIEDTILDITQAVKAAIHNSRQQLTAQRATQAN